jgi:hypothetical protein
MSEGSDEIMRNGHVFERVVVYPTLKSQGQEAR